LTLQSQQLTVVAKLQRYIIRTTADSLCLPCITNSYNRKRR